MIIFTSWSCGPSQWPHFIIASMYVKQWEVQSLYECFAHPTIDTEPKRAIPRCFVQVTRWFRSGSVLLVQLLLSLLLNQVSFFLYTSE